MGRDTCWLGVVPLLAFFWPASATAEVGWLDWQAPEECPSSEDIDAKLTQLLGRKLNPTRELHVVSAVSWSAQGWGVNVDIAYGESQGERTVVAKTCGEAADFVALAVALAVHPELLAGAESAASSEPSDADPAQDQARPEEDERGEQQSPEGQAAQDQATPQTAVSASSHDEDSVPWQFVVRPEFVVGWLALPKPGFGPRLEIGLSRGAWYLALGGAWLLPRQVTFDAAREPASFQMAWGELTGCYRIGLGQLRWGPCLAMQVGALLSSSAGGSYSEKDIWLAPVLGIDGAWRLGERLAITARLSGAVPLSRPVYQLAGGTVVHELPAAEFQNQLGIDLAF